MSRFDINPVRPDKNQGAIEVPQGMFAIGYGPTENIQYMTTRVAQCVAVACVASIPEMPHPMINLAHIDDAVPGDESMRFILGGIMAALAQSSNPSPLQVYVLNGDHEPALLNSILKALNDAGISYKTNIEDSQCQPLSIDLQTGIPVRLSDETPIWEPDKVVKDAHMRYVFSPRGFGGVFLDEPMGWPMSCAFRLIDGRPDYYQMKAPQPVPGNTEKLRIG